MDDREFRLLRDLIKEHAGLLYGEDTAYLLQRRLQPRLEALGLRSFSAYCDYLLDLTGRLGSSGKQRHEMDEAFDRIATKETYFFREDYQLSAFREEVLPRIHREAPRGRTLRVWSAGCSTGEEPYTLAIQILETQLFADWEVQVVGSDLSQSALVLARAGIYGASSFRQTDPKMGQRYFREATGRRQVIDEVRRLVEFNQINLNQPDWSQAGGPFDVIFCRNVLIYFDRARRAQVVDRFDRQIFPGGYLFLGHSESLLDTHSSFELHHLKRDLIYRKPNP